jgi:hypothetical protein
MTSRARRVTVRAVNYAKEQEFSDEDIFEEDELEGDRSKSSGAAPVRRRRRKKADVDDADAFATTDRPVFTEKGYDPTLPPLRERFPFLPEYEDDGSPKIELIVGRRPVDEKEDKNSNNTEAEDDDDDVADEKDSDKDSDDDDRNDGDENEESLDLSEGRRRRLRRAVVDDAESTPTKTKRSGSADAKKKKMKGVASPGTDEVVEYEYLVKFKGKSYLHLEWKTGADLESMNKSAKGIYRRYLKKLAAGIDEELENPEFDPLYVVPQKIIDVAEQEVAIELTDKELRKWEKEREKELQDAKDEAAEEDEEKANDSAAAGALAEAEKERNGASMFSCDVS